MSDGQEPIDLGPTPVRLPVREPSVFICVPPSAPCGSTCTPLQRRVVIATLISGHLLLSLLLPFFMYRPRTYEWLFAAALGICVSQVNLIAVGGDAGHGSPAGAAAVGDPDGCPDVVCPRTRESTQFGFVDQPHRRG